MLDLLNPMSYYHNTIDTGAVNQKIRQLIRPTGSGSLARSTLESSLSSCFHVRAKVRTLISMSTREQERRLVYQHPTIRAFLAFLALAILGPCVLARNTDGDPRFYASLKRLDPSTRLDQICDYEAMLRIGRDPHNYHPDRAKAEASSSPQRGRHSIVTNGGAFRSNGRWYTMSYTCQTGTDNLSVTYFSYSIGKAIPTSEWSKYGLWR